MPKSREIADYMQVKLADLRPGEVIPFDVHLYFAQNRHVMLWRAKGDVITEHFLDKYRSRGVEILWVHRDDAEEYYRYFNPAAFDPQAAEREALDAEALAAISANAAPARAAAEAAAAGDAAPTYAPPAARTEPGRELVEALTAPDLTEEERKEKVAQVAQEVVKLATTPTSQKTQKLATRQAREIVHDVLEGSGVLANSTIAGILRLANVDPDLEHAVNVSTYAVIFAMAFGRIDTSLLGDVALAGLLHDIGLSQVSAMLTRVAWKKMTPEMNAAYSVHVAATIELIQDLAPEVPDRVKHLIAQHHEKFDGSGYPRRLQGFGFDDVAQLVSIADTLDSMSSGLWDGQPRTLGDTFETLIKLEKARTFPEYFNPEVFAAVVGWIRNQADDEAAAGAVDIVKTKARDLVTKAAAS